MNGIIFLSLAMCCAALASPEPAVGSPKTLTGDARQVAIALLETTLAQLDTGDGPSYKSISVGLVTRQIVSGDLFTYNDVELDTGTKKKTCTIKVWTQPWVEENSTNVEIHCQFGDGNGFF
ncbi:cystatin-like protein [Drosophila subobscura]|uniref:cystatin-like protein n=1 Tax=Drosophila subobscura TaxID=7241 RepID=UPI00155A2487|nr:cystatin-like protein [Drosophila subobscura]